MKNKQTQKQKINEEMNDKWLMNKLMQINVQMYMN